MELRIHIDQPEQVQPRPARIPRAEARRWLSPFEGKRSRRAVAVFVTQPAYARICIHAGSDLDNEVGGVLVGQWYRDETSAQQFIVAENVIPARYTRQSPVYLTFTQDSLVHFHNTIEEQYPGQCIVGWYHTHPRMGIFLSQYDTWLHSSFFPEPWQVALVVDPHSASAGFFIRQAGGGLDPQRYSGFYELNGALGRSLVHWQNLEPVWKERESRKT